MLSNIILDQTVFFPEGGRQPGDRGEIVGRKGLVKVEYTRMVDRKIKHQGEIIDGLTKGDEVIARIDWNWRYKYMKIHSAGHLVHDVLMILARGLEPLKGSHGKKAFLEYSGSVDVSLKDKLEEKVNEVIGQDLPIVTKEAVYEELEKECRFLPPNFPKNKKLRMIKIGDYPAMPDGGVHVESTREIGKILITNLTSEENKTTVKYRAVG